MERHAGTVQFESVEHEGTTVRLRMPLRGAGGVAAGPAAPESETV
jgi:hypothetical protein